MSVTSPTTSPSTCMGVGRVAVIRNSCMSCQAMIALGEPRSLLKTIRVPRRSAAGTLSDFVPHRSSPASKEAFGEGLMGCAPK